ncbi:MAG: hypothetical protein OD918_08525 [Gammaproteobacteria bacterium]
MKTKSMNAHYGCILRAPHRSRAGACVEACDRDGDGDGDRDRDRDRDHDGSAILFGDSNNADSEIAMRMRCAPSRQARADLRLNTAVRYQNL